MILLRIITLGIIASLSTQALACDLDDCALPKMSHAVEAFDIDATTPPRTTLQFSAWKWIPHDLALARLAIAEDDMAQAISLLRNIDSAVRTKSKSVLSKAARSEARSLQDLVADLLLQAGATPVAELPAPRHRHVAEEELGDFNVPQEPVRPADDAQPADRQLARPAAQAH